MTKNYNLTELRALSSAYGKKEKQVKFSKFIAMPAIISSGLCYVYLTPIFPLKSKKDVILLLLGVFFGALGAFFGWKRILPQIVEREYHRNQFVEKNRFVNTLTQLMADKQRSVWSSLCAVSKRVDGQFKEDLEILISRLRNADEKEARASFAAFASRYEDDVFFSQYVDELCTAHLEGRGNLGTLQGLKDNHNLIKLKQEEFYSQKASYVFSSFVAFGIITGIVLSLHTLPSIGEAYPKIFSHNIVGWVDFGLYYLIMIWVFNRLAMGYFDDSVLQMKK
ncbi:MULTISPECIES: hypothetical protein [Lactococcus]|uniref:hypothetical protein n=1 Tax=Lactococcus TaxID=1357 RepID=UPI00324228F6